jgi:hypothetical protein
MDANSRPGTAMLLKKYAVDTQGAINFIESFLEPGRFLAQRLDHLGKPLDSKVLTVKEIAAMRLFTNLREARAVAGMTATRNAKMRATFGDLIR